MYSSSCFSGIFSFKMSLVSSNFRCMFPNLMESKTFFIRRSVLIPSILATSSSFFSKYFLFLCVSHQFFHSVNLMQEFSALYCWQACLRPRKTLYLNQVSVTISDIFSYRSKSESRLQKDNHKTYACLS